MSDQGKENFPHHIKLIEYQGDKWWKWSKMSIEKLSVDPIPNSPNYHHKNWLADNKENY